MSERGASAARTVARIEALAFTHVLMIPDSESRLLYDAVRGSALSVITPCREGESIAIAAGLWTGGRKPLVVLQNTGLMEAGDALRGCGLGCRVPLRLMVGWRGYGAAMAGRKPIDSAYTYTEHDHALQVILGREGGAAHEGEAAQGLRLATLSFTPRRRCR